MLLKNKVFLLGLLVWLMAIFRFFPFQPKELNYVKILILAAPLWLMPLALEIMRFELNVRWTALLLAGILAISFCLSPSILAAVLSIPWLFFALWLSWKTWQARRDNLSHLLAALFLSVGAAWAFADRLGFEAFGFDSTIVLLTAAHFHYAGFCLMLIAGWTERKSAIYGVLVGVPMVAIGISSSHLNGPPLLEVMAVTIMVAAGIWVGLLHLLLTKKMQFRAHAWLWLLAGLALISGMVLALLYGWRYYFPIPSLSIPSMYALHGTLNAIGFAAPALIAWWYAKMNINHSTDK
ncbi:MAG: YndJ family transporter [Bacteroidota bacterium]